LADGEKARGVDCRENLFSSRALASEFSFQRRIQRFSVKPSAQNFVVA